MCSHDVVDQIVDAERALRSQDMSDYRAETPVVARIVDVGGIKAAED